MTSCFSSLRNLWAQTSLVSRIGVLCALALGAGLRASRLDLFEFKGDELEGILRGLAAPSQHWWIDHGMTASVEVPFGPAFSYIMGLLTSFSHDPFVLTAFILAANIVVMMLAVLFFAEFSTDRKQFFLCVFLFSLSPYLIIASRKIWQPNLLLLFAIPLVLMVVRVNKKPFLLAPIGLLSSIMVQLHHSGLLYLPVLIFYMVVSFRTRCGVQASILASSDRDYTPQTLLPQNALSIPANRRSALFWGICGFIMFILPLIPYLTFLCDQFNFSKWMENGSHELCIGGALKWVLYSATGNDFWRYVSSAKRSQWNWPIPPFPGIVLIFCYFLLIPFLMGVFNYARAALSFLRKSHDTPDVPTELKTLLCPLSIAFLFVAYCFALQSGRPHHYIIIFPFLILALSNGILKLVDRAKPITLVLLCCGLASYTLQYPFVLSYVDVNNGYPGEYGVCYREQREAASRIAALADRGRIPLTLVVQLDNVQDFRKTDFMNTIAYICKTEFGVEVQFNSDPEAAGRILKLLNTGDRLHIVVE